MNDKRNEGDIEQGSRQGVVKEEEAETPVNEKKVSEKKKDEEIKSREEKFGGELEEEEEKLESAEDDEESVKTHDTQRKESFGSEPGGIQEPDDEEAVSFAAEQDDSDEQGKRHRGDPWEKWGEWRSSKKDRKAGHDGAFARGRGFVEGMVPDGLKKLLVAGLGALGSGEEGARRMASDLSLPKDAAGYLLAQVQSTKRELFRIIAGEIRDFLENVNLGAEIQRILTSLTFEIKMQVRLKPSKDDNSVRPEVKGKVKVLPRKKNKRE